MLDLLPVNEILPSPEAQPRVTMDWEVVETYKEALEGGETLPPITVFSDGQSYFLADGFHRLEAAKSAGWVGVEAEIKTGGLRDAILYSVGANADHGLQRNRQDKRKAVITLLEDPEWQQWSDREIARQCKVSHPFVSKLRPSHSGNVTTMDRKFIHHKTGEESTWSPKEKPDQLDYEQAEPDYEPEESPITYSQIETPENPAPPKPHILNHTGNDEWYTPPEYIEAARDAMGSIDVDPASCQAANQTVKATTYYTKEMNGLTLPWTGNVWMNPPYSKGNLAPFADALIQRLERAETMQAVVLVNSSTETKWYQLLLKYAEAICLPQKRITFIDQNGEPQDQNTQGQTFFYFGPHKEKFKDIFKKFGGVLYVERD